jgi:hypothetical protein
VPEDEYTRQFDELLRGMKPQRSARLRETRDRFTAEVMAWSEDVIGQLPEQQQTWDLGGGVSLYSLEMGFDSRMEAPERELPFSWTRELPMARVVRTRPRLLWMHRRRKTSRWAIRHGLMEEYLAVKYGLRFDTPVKYLIGTVRVA